MKMYHLHAGPPSSKVEDMRDMYYSLCEEVIPFMDIISMRVYARTKYDITICPNCAAHPEVGMLLLGGVAWDSQQI